MANANKRYYWLKLKEDFFDDDTMKWLEGQKNGKDYALFYLKLCLKSLKTDGVLIQRVGKVLIPYTAEALADLTRTDIDTVLVAMELFRKTGMVEILDAGEIFISQLQEMVGSETENAAAMRRLRARKAEALPEGNNVTPTLPKRYIEIEKDIEIDSDIEIEKKEGANSASPPSAPVPPTPKKGDDKPVKRKYGEYKHVRLTDDEFNALAADAGPDKTTDAIKYLDAYIEEKGYKSKSHYLAIRRWVFDAVAEQEQKKKAGSQKRYSRKEPTPGWADKPSQWAQDAVHRMMEQGKNAGNDPDLQERAEKLKQELTGGQT